MTCEVPGCERRATVVVVTQGIARSVCPIHASHPQETK